METEQNQKLTFLDVLITRSNNKFHTSVYRKPTFSGQGLSFFSFCNFRFKLNSIKTLLHRAYTICSSYISLDSEFNFLRQYFQNNGHALSLIEKTISKFLHSKFSNNDELKHIIKPKLYFVFPYFGSQSEKLKHDLMSLFNKYFKDHQLQIILTNNSTIGSLFNFKDKLTKGMTARTIYKWGCPNCGAHYISSTSRNLYIRAAEHSGVSYRTGQTSPVLLSLALGTTPSPAIVPTIFIQIILIFKVRPEI